jgi:prepilin-type N-terminal cleavage/methylation domain-containing protein
MNHVNKTKRQVAQQGFTLIELMLAMAGVAFLLLAIAMTTMQISNIYSKGLTIKSVNQTGRDVSDALQRDIKSSKPFDTASPSNYLNTPYGGRLCLGEYSYVWNYGKTLTSTDTTNTVLFDNGTPVRMARVLDTGGQVCVNAAANQPIVRADATELLSGSDKLDLALHTFAVSSSATDAAIGQALYSISFTLGTGDQQALMTGDASCKPPNDIDNSWEFCAVNVFDFTIRAGNRT